ncbi:MAG: guanylate kinase [Butyrivibrio sp.]|nr:guanylate kinase [Butyrivibrio sp.]
MGKIYCIMGKSSSGKDSIYQKIMESGIPGLEPLIPYTTRPIREGEVEGKEYHFCTESRMQALEAAGKVIERRTYHTVYGDWTYFTVDDGELNPAGRNYLYIITLEGYLKIRNYFGNKLVMPIYIEVEDGERLIRAIEREKRQEFPKYEEMCRRFIADAADFSEEKLKDAKIAKRFVNRDFADIIRQIITYITDDMTK